ncbi:sulfite exporter TauE/SafE family protein [Roseibium sp. MMSF_3544]|uniref:sulfite exporter TauE/SafE family protein n=1 Tax=unclassified Roseibium TaxID=2629323 RepID=UPI00273F2C39|nr:sulfite exporter TauE/SafE family protein [Roseibium sp. MMSF_3544]
MLEDLSLWTGLPPSHLVISATMVFIAGLVRGFAGFGLSAVLMASIVVIIPPVELIPVCFLLEAAASLAMFRGGLRDASWGTAVTLALFSAIGIPLGLALTTSIDAELSKLFALLLVLFLTFLQLLKINVLPTSERYALPATGFAAGVVSGLASVGGMVIALYVLASPKKAREMRGALVLYLFFSLFTSSITLFLFDVLDEQAAARGAILSPLVLAGVFIGSKLFSRSLDQTYRRVCLYLLVVFASAGLVRLVAF